MARFAVLCVVIALLFGKMKSHPLQPNAEDIDNNMINIDEQEISGNGDENNFKLPTALTNGMIIVIKGIMYIEKTFITVIKSISGDKQSLCTIQYNHDTIRVDYPNCNSPQCYDTQTDYILNTDLNKHKETTFALTLTARIDENKEGILDVVFEGNEHFDNGPSKLFTCPIKNLNDIGYIQLKQGVDEVNSILFNITSQNLTPL